VNGETGRTEPAMPPVVVAKNKLSRSVQVGHFHTGITQEPKELFPQGSPTTSPWKDFRLL
jgi:hypothetical protein